MVANGVELPFTIEKLFGENFGVLQMVWQQMTVLKDENKQLRALTAQALQSAEQFVPHALSTLLLCGLQLHKEIDVAKEVELGHHAELCKRVNQLVRTTRRALTCAACQDAALIRSATAWLSRNYESSTSGSC